MPLCTVREATLLNIIIVILPKAYRCWNKNWILDCIWPAYSTLMGHPVRLITAMYVHKILATLWCVGQSVQCAWQKQGWIIAEEQKWKKAQTFSWSMPWFLWPRAVVCRGDSQGGSGLANPQLIISHWETRQIWRMWHRNTWKFEEGLHIAKDIVEHTEKQRTLKKLATSTLHWLCTCMTYLVNSLVAR